MIERVIAYRSDWNDDREDRGRDVLPALVNEGSVHQTIETVVGTTRLLLLGG